MKTERVRASTPEVTADQRLSFVAVLNVLLKHLRLLVLLPLGLVVMVVAVSLFSPREYATSAAFMPQGGTSGSPLTGLAAQFGVGFPSTEPTESPDFYAALLTSRDLLAQVVETPYLVPGKAVQQRTLVQIYEAKGDTPAEKREDAIRRLRRNIAVGQDRKTGTVTVAASASTPGLSLQIAERMLDAVNKFDVENRQSRAHGERLFVEARLAQAKGELRATKDRVQVFLEQNRDYGNSPLLKLRENELEHEMDLAQQIVATLSQNYERARIDEVRDTPLITVVEKPVLPVRPKGTGVIRRSLLAIVIGLLLAITFAVIVEFFAAAKLIYPEDYARMRHLWGRGLGFRST